MKIVSELNVLLVQISLPFRINQCSSLGIRINISFDLDTSEVNVSAFVFLLLPRHLNVRPLDIIVDNWRDTK